MTETIESRLERLSADDACGAASVGGPVAFAPSRIDRATRLAVCREYLESIGGWRSGAGDAIRSDFQIVHGRKTG